MGFVVLKIITEIGKCLAVHWLKEGIHIWHCLNLLHAPRMHFCKSLFPRHNHGSHSYFLKKVISWTRFRKVFMALPSKYQWLAASSWEHAKPIPLGSQAKLLHQNVQFMNTNTHPPAISADGPVRQAKKWSISYQHRSVPPAQKNKKKKKEKKEEREGNSNPKSWVSY